MRLTRHDCLQVLILDLGPIVAFLLCQLAWRWW